MNWIKLSEKLPPEHEKKILIRDCFNDIHLGWIEYVSTTPGEFNFTGDGASLYYDKAQRIITHWCEIEEPKE